MRICLGKILLQQPDILLLDEPTNHLDLSATAWLEDYLKKQTIPIVIVSHDREFLDQLCTKIVEIERGRSSTYKGNYSDYVRQKEERTTQQWERYEKQEKELKRQEEIATRLRAGGNAARAQVALKAIEKMKLPENYVERPFTWKKRQFRFPPVDNMGQTAVEIKNMTYKWASDVLFKDMNLEIEKGEKVALIGPNGAGKSTLLKLIMGKI